MCGHGSCRKELANPGVARGPRRLELARSGWCGRRGVASRVGARVPVATFAPGLATGKRPRASLAVSAGDPAQAGGRCAGERPGRDQRRGRAQRSAQLGATRRPAVGLLGRESGDRERGWSPPRPVPTLAPLTTAPPVADPLNELLLGRAPRPGLVPRLPAARLRQHGVALPGAVSAHRQQPAWSAFLQIGLQQTLDQLIARKAIPP